MFKGRVGPFLNNGKNLEDEELEKRMGWSSQRVKCQTSDLQMLCMPSVGNVSRRKGVYAIC